MRGIEGAMGRCVGKIERVVGQGWRVSGSPCAEELRNRNSI